MKSMLLYFDLHVKIYHLFSNVLILVDVLFHDIIHMNDIQNLVILFLNYYDQLLQLNYLLMLLLNQHIYQVYEKIFFVIHHAIIFQHMQLLNQALMLHLLKYLIHFLKMVYNHKTFVIKLMILFLILLLLLLHHLLMLFLNFHLLVLVHKAFVLHLNVLHLILFHILFFYHLVLLINLVIYQYLFFLILILQQVHNHVLVLISLHD
mmetsp:Transcript_7411/g.7834  ORF Transcript_7411/g.7834 Transcript_7411/m.7834 type:complete len:206 (+) Transcript_7411:198-815(+)